MTRKSDKPLTSPYNITPKSHIKVMKIKEMITSIEALDFLSNSPCQHLGKCKENSMENIHTDVRVQRVKQIWAYWLNGKVSRMNSKINAG